MAGFAIYMQRLQGWTRLEALVWFAIAIVVFVVPFQWVAWRISRFSRAFDSPTVPNKRATYLSLTLALLCWVILAVGFAWPEKPTHVFRFLGFFLGGVTSFGTLLLCAYYFQFQAVRTKGLLLAFVVSAIYAVPAVSFIGLLYAEHPIALKVLKNAF
jgi:hypothetical protein